MRQYIIQQAIIVAWAIFFIGLAKWHSVWDVVQAVIGFVALSLTVEVMKNQDLYRKSLSRTQRIIGVLAQLAFAVVIAFLFYGANTYLPAHYRQLVPFAVIICFCVVSVVWEQLKAEAKAEASATATNDSEQGL